MYEEQVTCSELFTVMQCMRIIDNSLHRFPSNSSLHININKEMKNIIFAIILKRQLKSIIIVFFFLIDHKATNLYSPTKYIHTRLIYRLLLPQPHSNTNMNNGFFLDSEKGQGIWTPHYTDQGQLYYYNMKKGISKWGYEFGINTETPQPSSSANPQAESKDAPSAK